MNPAGAVVMEAAMLPSSSTKTNSLATNWSCTSNALSSIGRSRLIVIPRTRDATKGAATLPSAPLQVPYSHRTGAMRTSENPSSPTLGE